MRRMTMQYDAQTPKEYLEMLEDDWRKERLLEVRQLILDLAPELTETVRYKMLTYEAGEQFIFGLNAQKGYVSLYIGDIDKIEGARALLEPFDLGKGCIRIRKTVDISKTGLEDFIKAVVEMHRKGKDTSC
jgi:uncharacterized protein YdhG (YjbR/CyaY superfamily)